MEELSLREVQLEELNILIEFDRICRSNNLKYSLAGGTLLGAVRHKGFIPWDDDIDVCMPRRDYEKLITIFNDKRQLNQYVIDENNIYPFIKIFDKNIQLEWHEIEEVPHLWIDVFPMDGFYESIKKVKRIQKIARFYRKIIYFSRWRSFSDYNGKHNKLVALFLFLFLKIYGAKRALKKLNKLSKHNSYESSKYIGAISWGLYGLGERMLKSEFEQFTEIEFEGKNFSVMGCWDSYLQGIYGDYMQLPPEEKRITHKIKAYRVENEK